MTDFFSRLFDTDFMPHVLCLRTPGLVWLHALSDGLIAIAYFLTPFGLLRLVQKRRDLAFHWMFILFAIFILSCGATHVLSIVTLWVPVYRFEGLVKVITAISSLPTAVLLIRLVPTISMLPSPQQWRQSNEELKAEIAQRKTAEAAILSLNASLEHRVEERTTELEEQNVKLQELKKAWDLAHGFIRDMSGAISFWCEGSEQLYGWSKEEALGCTSHRLLNTQFPKPLPEVELELAEKGSWTGELFHTNKKGLRLHVATHWILQRSATGAPVSVIEVNNDMTDRTRADEASLRLADLVESSNDAIIGSTLDGAITNWNSSAEALFGYSAPEIIGRSINVLKPVTKRGEQDEIVTHAAQGEGASRYETLRVAKDGREVAVSLTVSPIRNSHGSTVGTSQIIRDISEAKAREEAFHLSEERQRLAVESGQVGLWYLDVESNRCIWTERCKTLHGLTSEELVPDYPDCLALVHPDDCEALRDALSRTIGRGDDFAIEYRTRGLDFRTNWIQTRGRAQRDLNGKVIGIHGTVIDLTARREMEDKLRRVNTELEQFAYAAAHDLQEPLRNVALAASILKAGGNLTGWDDEIGQTDWLNVVAENALRMDAMVKDLLAYSRSLDGADDRDANIDANLVLNNALLNLASGVTEKRASLTSDILPFVAMQETHLLQLFQNLVGNALKYSGVETPRIHVGAQTRHGDVLLFVKDNGVGIAPQFHDRAFRLFKRLHNGSVEGTGIGLATCKRIVEHYGGEIWIESQAGEGATFFFTIPSRRRPV